jgi:hypothetical protein
MTEHSTGFDRTDDDVLLDEILARTDDSVLRALDAALEPDAGLAAIFHQHPLRPVRRHRDTRPRASQGRPPQGAVADQPRGSQRP